MLADFRTRIGSTETPKSKRKRAPAANRTRGQSMATTDFTTKPLALWRLLQTAADIFSHVL